MGERSVYSSVMLTLLVVVVAASTWCVLDNQDLVKQQQLEVAKGLRDISNQLAALRKTIEQAPLAARVVPAGGNAATSGNNTPPAQAAFANSEFIDPDADDGGRMVGYTVSFTGNMNYLVNNEAMVGSIWDTCNDSLAERNYQRVMEFQPKAAKSWEVSDDGLTWTIHLRKDVTWHPYTDPITKEDIPARPVTADDYLFYWETIQNENLPCEHTRSYLNLVDRFEKVDDYTFRVIWKEPYSLAESITLSLTPLPKHYYRPDASWSDEEFARQMVSSARNQMVVGCGPYRFVSWDKGKGLVLERYENYYGPKPAIRVRKTVLIQTPEKALIELQNGTLDRIGLQPEQWKFQTGEPQFLTVTKSPATAQEDALRQCEAKKNGTADMPHTFEKYMYPRYAWAYIGYNMSRPLFKDKRVRVALTHCVDRARIVDEVMLGFAEIITGPFVAHSPYYDKTVEPYPFDLKKGKSILAEAGWTDTDNDGLLDKDLDGDGKRDPFEFTFSIPSGSDLIRRWATIVAEDMGKAGIRVNLKPLEWSVYTEMLDERSYDVCSLLWGGGLESDPYQIWHSSGAGKKGSSNHVNYASKEADALIDKGRRTLDRDERVKIYHQFHRLLHEDQPYTFLLGMKSLVAQHKRFQNTRLFVEGMPGNIMWVRMAEQLP